MDDPEFASHVDEQTEFLPSVDCPACAWRRVNVDPEWPIMLAEYDCPCHCGVRWCGTHALMRLRVLKAELVHMSRWN